MIGNWIVSRQGLHPEYGCFSGSWDRSSNNVAHLLERCVHTHHELSSTSSFWNYAIKMGVGIPCIEYINPFDSRCFYLALRIAGFSGGNSYGGDLRLYCML